MNDIDCKILISRIEELANERGLNLTTVFVESGAGKNFKSNLRIAKPSLGKITLIANYLDTTPEYLIGETDVKERSPEEHTEEISPDELALIKSYRRNTEEIKKAARAVLGVGEDDYEPDYKLVAFGGDKRVNKTIKPKLT